MKPPISLLRPYLSFLLLAILTICVYVSCRKIDEAAPESPVTAAEHISPEAKFFNEHPPQHPLVGAIRSWMKRHNDEKPFLETFIARAGYPRWDKAKALPGPAIFVETEDSSAAYDYVYIPFVQEPENKVNSIMVVRASDTDTTSAFVMDWQYKDYGFDDEASGWSAEKIFLLFANFDYTVFGHHHFLLTDSLLFSGIYPVHSNNANGRPIRLHVPSTTEFFPSAECIGVVTLTTLYIPTGNCNCPSSWTSCDLCSVCATPFTYSFCDPANCRGITIECGGNDAPPPLPPGEGGGGGSGGGNGPEPPPPCEVNCDGGWLPILPPPNKTPCDIAHSAAKNMDSVYVKSNANAQLATIPNLATDPNENGFRIFKTFNIVSQNPPQIEITGYVTEAVTQGTPSGINFPTSVPSMHISVAKLHTHPPDGRSAPSAKDIYNLIENRVDNSYYEGDFIAAADGTKYAFTVTNLSQASAFLDSLSGNLSGTDWNPSSLIGKAFREAYDYLYDNDSTKLNYAYEMAMAAVLNQFNVGVTLHKKDVNGNFKPIVVKTTVPNPNKPMKKVYTQECL